MAVNGVRYPIRVRPYEPADRMFVLSLVPRLSVGVAPWRDSDKMAAVMGRFINEDLATIGERAAVLVSEDADGRLLGFVTVGHNINFTGKEQAYVGELAVAESAEGRGIGKALMAAAETWAGEHSYGLVVLETGAANARARSFYAALGYREESVKLVKQLGSAAESM